MAKPLSKSKIVAHVAEKVGTSKKVAAQFFEELFKLAVKEAKGGAGKFVIPNIGRVVKAHRKARMGRNPQTGEAIKIKAKTVVRLRAAKALKDAILGYRGASQTGLLEATCGLGVSPWFRIRFGGWPGRGISCSIHPASLLNFAVYRSLLFRPGPGPPGLCFCRTGFSLSGFGCHVQRQTRTG